MSAGHDGPKPVQFSGPSQGCTEPRQSVPPGTKPSPGQPGPVPLHESATSQMSTAGRQIPPTAKLSPGHAAIPPVQVSCTSHTPATPRHTVPDDTKPSAG